MAEAEETKKSGKGGLILGVALMLALGGGGFFAARSGLIPSFGGEASAGADAHGPAEGKDGHGSKALADVLPLDGVAFLPVEPLVVSLGTGGQARHLRFRAQLEVPGKAVKEVAHLMPRVVDVMNGYLRSVDPAEFDDRGAMIRLRAQLLRRVELVVGTERVLDLLVMEFVLS